MPHVVEKGENPHIWPHMILGVSKSTILGVYNASEPDAALQHWHGAFVSVYDKRAPFKTTRGK